MRPHRGEETSFSSLSCPVSKMSFPFLFPFFLFFNLSIEDIVFHKRLFSLVYETGTIDRRFFFFPPYLILATANRGSPVFFLFSQRNKGNPTLIEIDLSLSAERERTRWIAFFSLPLYPFFFSGEGRVTFLFFPLPEVDLMQHGGTFFLYSFPANPSPFLSSSFTARRVDLLLRKGSPEGKKILPPSSGCLQERTLSFFRK